MVDVFGYTEFSLKRAGWFGEGFFMCIEGPIFEQKI